MNEVIESNVIMVGKDPVEFLAAAIEYGKDGWWVACVLPEDKAPTTATRKWVNVLFQRHAT